MTRIHGGPDAQGVPRWDFSSNANACGPCPEVAEQLREADARHYPDPAYQALRHALADFHGVPTWRVVLAASASEFIMRLTACVARTGGKQVWLPEMAYGEYAHAAAVWNLARGDDPCRADLCWLCEPSSPLGAGEPRAVEIARSGTVTVLDRAYEPLRLSGACSLSGRDLDRVWQLWSPNKALGMTGIRGAYAIAPADGEAMAQALERLSASWPLGAHAVVMLSAWVTPSVRDWLAAARKTLQAWKTDQLALLSAWPQVPGQANFFCLRAAWDAQALRRHGIKLRDTTSFGLAGYWRLSVQPPEAQAALRAALDALGRPGAVR